MLMNVAIILELRTAQGDSIQNAVFSISLGPTQSHNQSATMSVSPGVKRAGREAEFTSVSFRGEESVEL